MTFGIIACDEGPAHVVSIAHTKVKEELTAVHSLSKSTFSGRERGKELEADLKNFAIFIYHQLLSREDDQYRFETLRVGVRLDIGLSKTRDFQQVRQATSSIELNQLPPKI